VGQDSPRRRLPIAGRPKQNHEVQSHPLRRKEGEAAPDQAGVLADDPSSCFGWCAPGPVPGRELGARRALVFTTAVVKALVLLPGDLVDVASPEARAVFGRG
jgi:hypothetical protein